MNLERQKHATVIVIGAGVAGLAAARVASAAGMTVRVLEKSRGLGGRSATRTVQGVRVDHGAQFLTVRTDAFRSVAHAWRSDGRLVEWSDGFDRFAGGRVQRRTTRGHPRFVFPNGMNEIGKALAVGLDVVREAHVRHVRFTNDRWQVAWSAPGDDASTHVDVADTVVVTAPVPQALPWIDDEGAPSISGAPTRDDLLATIRYRPCFAWMAAFDAPAPPWMGLTVEDHPVLSWLSNDGSKRPSPSHHAVLVAHTTARFAEARFDDDRAAVGDAVQSAVAEIAPFASTPTWTNLHRWRYALVDTPWSRPFTQLARGLYLAGDGFAQVNPGEVPPPGRVESAWVSGTAVGRAVAAMSTHA